MRHARSKPFVSALLSVVRPPVLAAGSIALAAVACGGQSGTIAPVDAGAVSDAGPGPVLTQDGGHVVPDAGPDASPPPGPSSACKSPVPIVVGGTDTGYDSCQGGTVRRRAIVACPVLPIPPSTCTLPAPASGTGCAKNSDCTAGANATCVTGSGLAGPYCICTYGCVHDSDCESGSICVCGDPVGHCETSACNAGTCGTGLDCAEETSEPGCGLHAFACTTPTDTCFSDSDCNVAGQESCTAGDPPGVRRCSPPTCAF